MKPIVMAAAIICAGTCGNAQAEVQDCIEITALPATITVQGTHCLKQDLATTITSGNAITIATNNVILDMNGFKLGGLGSGPGTQAVGIFAIDRQNITIRNGTVRGFGTNIHFDATGTSTQSRGHIVEDMRIDAARSTGIRVEGFHTILRDNFIANTGNSTLLNTARAISIVGGEGHPVSGNVISQVEEDFAASGIVLTDTTGAVVERNKVRALKATTTLGITTSVIGIEASGTRNVVIDNIISNASQGNFGIQLSAGSEDACLDNVIANYITPTTGCSLSDANRTF